MKPPQRPVGALVIAILNFVFGGFGLMGVVCGGLYAVLIIVLFSIAPTPPPAAPGAPGPPDPTGPLRILWEGMTAIPGFIPYAVVNTVKGTIAPFLLLISGYGLVKMRRYGRSLAIFYAVMTLVFVVIDAGYSLAVLNEGALDATQRYMDALREEMNKRPGAPPPMPMNIKQMLPPAMLVGSTFFSALIASAYPIAILAVMYRRDVRAAYSGIAPVVLPSPHKRSERPALAEQEEVQDALPGARPALEEGIKEADDPGVRAPKEDA